MPQEDFAVLAATTHELLPGAGETRSQGESSLGVGFVVLEEGEGGFEDGFYIRGYSTRIISNIVVST